MKCEFCTHDFPMSHLSFIEDGRVPGIVGMTRRRARCMDCQKKGFVTPYEERQLQQPAEPTQGTEDNDYPF